MNGKNRAPIRRRIVEGCNVHNPLRRRFSRLRVATGDFTRDKSDDGYNKTFARQAVALTRAKFRTRQRMDKLAV